MTVAIGPTPRQPVSTPYDMASGPQNRRIAIASSVTTSPAISRPASFPFRGSSAGSLGEAPPPRMGTSGPRATRRASRITDASTWPTVVIATHSLGGRSDRERASSTAARLAAIGSRTTSRPMPATMSTVSEANRARATESSEKPSTDDISPDDEVPASSIPGYRARTRSIMAR